jgi:transposase-like protein
MLMEANVAGKIGAGRHERSGARITYRNGYRDRGLDRRSPTQALLPHATLKYPRPYP